MSSSENSIKTQPEPEPGTSASTSTTARHGVKRKVEVELETPESHKKLNSALDRILPRIDAFGSHLGDNKPRNMQRKINNKLIEIQGQEMHADNLEAFALLDAETRRRQQH